MFKFVKQNYREVIWILCYKHHKEPGKVVLLAGTFTAHAITLAKCRDGIILLMRNNCTNIQLSLKYCTIYKHKTWL